MRQKKKDELLRLLKDLTAELSHLEFINCDKSQDASLLITSKRDELLKRSREAISELNK